MGGKGPSMPDLLKKMVAKRKKKSSRDKREPTVDEKENPTQTIEESSQPSSSNPSTTPASNRRKKAGDRTVEESTAANRKKKSLSAKAEKKAKDEKAMDKDDKEKDQSTEFEDVKVASRPAVTKNKRRTLQCPGETSSVTAHATTAGKAKEDKAEEKENKEKEQSTEFEEVKVASRPAVTKNKRRTLQYPGEQASVTSHSIAAPSSSTGSLSNHERTKNSSKDKKKNDEDEPTVFQKVNAADRPAKTRMKSHRSGSNRAKEMVKKPAEEKTKKEAKDVAMAGALDRDTDEQAPTRFEMINADVRTAIVNEKPRKLSRKVSRRSSRKVKEKEEKGPTVDEQEQADPNVDNTTAAMMAPVEKREASSKAPTIEKIETCEEQDFPENPAYAYELGQGKPKIVDKHKESNPMPPPQPPPPSSKPEPSKKKNNDDDDCPKSDYIIKY